MVNAKENAMEQEDREAQSEKKTTTPPINKSLKKISRATKQEKARSIRLQKAAVSWIFFFDLLPDFFFFNWWNFHITIG